MSFIFLLFCKDTNKKLNGQTNKRKCHQKVRSGLDVPTVGTGSPLGAE